MNLRLKLALTNLLFKLVFTGLFLVILPYLSERINLYQTDDELIEKREHFFNLISEVGIEPFLFSDSINVFGSYNILKEEFISIEKTDIVESWNFIEVTHRLIEGEVIEYRVLNYTFRVDGVMYLLEIGKSLSSISATEKNIKRIFVIFLIAFLIISFVFELIYTRTLLVPLNIIVRKIKTSSHPTSYNRQPVKTSTTDFTTLDSTLSELMDKIDRLFKKEKEITENISHELLTPVSILRSKLENMLVQEDLSENALIKTEEALITLQRLKALVNSLLLIARVESSQYLKNDTIEINNLITNITEELKPMAEEVGLNIQLNFRIHKTIEHINQSLLFTMFYNVVNNAIKNTPTGGTVTIETACIKKQFIVSISDNGTGIPVNEMESLFLRFKKKKTNDNKGTGIGLAITKSIADFHNIQIKVESIEGKGSAFEFLFPEE